MSTPKATTAQGKIPTNIALPTPTVQDFNGFKGVSPWTLLKKSAIGGQQTGMLAELA
jgi:hypothetical protein